MAFGVIARDFLASLDDVLDRAAQARDAGDLGTLAEIGHSLKGSGGTFGFPELTALGARLEEVALDADGSATAAAIGELTQFIECTAACP